MTLRIIHSNEPLHVEHVIITLYGQPGVGKSTLGFSADAPILMDFDGGAYRALNRKDVAPIERWEDVTAITDDDLAPFNTIVVDTVGKALGVLARHLIAVDPKMATRSGALTLPGYGALKSTFTSWLDRMCLAGKNIILLAHQKEDKQGDDLIVRPDITGGSLGHIIEESDAVGFLYQSATGRVLDFNPTDHSIGKNPFASPPVKVPDITDRQNTFMADLIQSLLDHVNNMSDEQRAFLDAVEEWTKSIAEMEAVDDFTKAIPQTQEIADKSLSTAIKRMLFEAAKAHGYIFNKEKGSFVDPVAYAASSKVEATEKEREAN